MKNYWIRIALGALVVFALGMIVVSVVRRIRTVATTDGDIVFPLAFVPFRVDGTRLGEFKRVRVVRAAPDSVDHIELRVALDDTAAAAPLRDCVLVLNELQNIELSRTTFVCASAADTIGQDLVPFGRLELPAGEDVTFLVPRREVYAAGHDYGSWERAAEYGDSVAEAAAERADSIAEAADARADSLADAASALADSIADVHLQRADSIRTIELRRADSIREAGLRLADSVRAAPAPDAP